MPREGFEVAVGVIGERFPAALAAFLGGSALTADRTATSDLDVVVVLPGAFQPYRRIVRAHGWPVELFVHTRGSLDRFWALDIAARRAPLLRMCAEGRILAGQDDVAEVIQAEARRLLAVGPPPATDEELQVGRYRLTNLLDDLEGRADSPELAYIAAGLLTAAAELVLLSSGQWLGAGKWLGRRLAGWDGDLAARLVAAHRRAIAEGELEALQAVIGDVLDRVGGRLGEGYHAVAPTSPP